MFHVSRASGDTCHIPITSPTQCHLLSLYRCCLCLPRLEPHQPSKVACSASSTQLRPVGFLQMRCHLLPCLKTSCLLLLNPPLYSHYSCCFIAAANFACAVLICHSFPLNPPPHPSVPSCQLLLLPPATSRIASAASLQILTPSTCVPHHRSFRHFSYSVALDLVIVSSLTPRGHRALSPAGNCSHHVVVSHNQRPWLSSSLTTRGHGSSPLAGHGSHHLFRCPSLSLTTRGNGSHHL